MDVTSCFKIWIEVQNKICFIINELMDVEIVIFDWFLEWNDESFSKMKIQMRRVDIEQVITVLCCSYTSIIKKIAPGSLREEEFFFCNSFLSCMNVWWLFDCSSKHDISCNIFISIRWIRELKEHWFVESGDIMVWGINLPKASVVISKKWVFHLNGLFHVLWSFVTPKERFLIDRSKSIVISWERIKSSNYCPFLTKIFICVLHESTNVWSSQRNSIKVHIHRSNDWIF